MSTVVDFANVGRHLAKQFGQGHGLLPNQLAAFELLGQAQRANKTLGQAASDFTTAWRSAGPLIVPAPSPAPVVTPEQRQTIWRSAVRLTNLEQPDESTCQSATIAMLLGEDAAEIPKIRQALLALGSAGSPQVMAQYLRSRLGGRYELSMTANLHECVLWLKGGEALGTHGWHTSSGHVFLLDEVDLDPDLAAPRFSVKDPYGEFDFKTWKFKPGTRFYDGWISALGIYSLCVVIGGVGVSKGAYRDGDVSLEQRGMWVHRVKPTVSPVPAQVLQAQARRRINAAGRKIITDSEGLSLKAYLCPSQVWTIGRGSTIWFDNRPVRSGQTCTQVQADQLFDRDLSRFELDVSELVTSPTSDNQFSALVSFAHNCGSDRDGDGIAEGLGDSTLLRLHNKGDYAGARKEFAKWVKDDRGEPLPGLVTRRAKEAELYGRT